MRMKKRGGLMVALGLALTAGLFGFAASPAQALSISGTYTDVAFGSAGTGGPVLGFQAGLVGAIGSSLSGGFPPTGSLGNNFWLVGSPGVTADGFGTRVDNATGLTLPAGFATNFFAQGQANDATKYLAVHWTAAFSNTLPVTFSLSADDHAFLYVDGKLVLDDGGIKGISFGSVATAFSVTGNHTLDLFFADVHAVQSALTFSCAGCVDDSTSTAPEPATLVLFGTTLVGLGAVIRRQLKGGKKAA